MSRELDDLDHWQGKVGAWADATFPHATPATALEHLEDELLLELDPAVAAVLATTPDDPLRRERAVAAAMEELADVVLIALHLAHRLERSLMLAMATKFAIVQGRTYGPPDARGVSHHLAEGDHP